MAFQTYTSPSSGAYRDIVTKLVAFATSKHVSAVVLNAAGTGYTAGDILTITHAGAVLPCTLEVLTIGGGGAVATVAIRSSGAFSNRVSSLAVVAGGSGYVTGDVIRLTTGTFTEFAKATVTAAAGAVTALAVFETGGAYSVAPSASGATNSDIGLGTGTGCTCTPTMTTLVGTTGIAVTGGTGTGATFDLTLTDTGWTAIWNRNDYSFNSITNEKEIILQGTVAGGLPPLVGLRTYTATSGTTRYGTLIVGMDSYNPSLTFATMPNVGPNVDPSSQTGICWLMYDNAQPCWFVVNPRRIVANVKAVGGAVTTDMSMYAGLLSPFGTQVESPYPMYLSGTTGAHNRRPEDGGAFVTGLTEGVTDAAAQRAAVFRRHSDGAWTSVINNTNFTSVPDDHVIYPLGLQALATSGGTNEDNIAANGQLALGFGASGIAITGGGAPTQVLMTTLGSNEMLLIPATILSAPNGTSDNNAETIPRGEMDGVFWTPGTKSDATKVVREDTITVSGVRYVIFQNAHRTENYSFFALKMA